MNRRGFMGSVLAALGLAKWGKVPEVPPPLPVATSGFAQVGGPWDIGAVTVTTSASTGGPAWIVVADNHWNVQWSHTAEG